MSDYNRTTRECPVSQLHPEVLLALRNYFQEQKLGDLEAETALCCETISTKKNMGRLVAWLHGTEDTTILTGMLLTSQWLIWVRSGDQSGMSLSAANLNLISARPYTSLFVRDTGLEISGYLNGSKAPIRGYIAMGSEAAAQKFCDEVSQAITKLNPPKQRARPKWLGG
jgi:hypothetical protein